MLIFICDDEPQELVSLQNCLKQAAAGLAVEASVSAYPSGEALVQAVENHIRPALAVLDIYMEGMGGIETGRRLRALLPELPLAFLTTSREFAVDAFALDALHYIVKPVTVQSARVLLERLSARTGKPPRVLELPARQGASARFPLDQISRVVSKSRGVEIHIPGRGGAWIPCPFREVEARLAGEPDFLLLSRGCIVNLNSVQRIDFDVCCLRDGERLPVSRRERVNVQSRYSDFLFRRLERIKGGTYD